jgi:hypothetical protein
MAGLTTASQPNAAFGSCYRVAGDDVRQPVTRQKTTPSIARNATTLLALLDPDQDALRKLIRRPDGQIPYVVMIVEKERIQIRHTPYPWGQWV